MKCIISHDASNILIQNINGGYDLALQTWVGVIGSFLVNNITLQTWVRVISSQPVNNITWVGVIGYCYYSVNNIKWVGVIGSHPVNNIT